MPLTDYKVTSYGGKDVASAPDVLTGKVAENKALFDLLTKGVIVPNFNALIDALVSTAGANSGAAQIGVTVPGVAGNTVYAVLEALQTSKVDKVAGKQLSTNDYTADEKDKLAGIATNANNYTLPIASAAVLGGIKVGAGLEVQADGTVNGVSAPAPDLVARQQIAEHEANGTIHVDSEKKAEWDGKAAGNHSHNLLTYTATHSKSGTVHTLTGLPTVTGIYIAQFKAVANFDAGNTFAGGYTAKPMGEETALPDKAFITGDLVSVVVDVSGKKLGFRLGGGGGKLNIFAQTTAPPSFEGIWLQTSEKFNSVVCDYDVYTAGTWATGFANIPTGRSYLGCAAVGISIGCIGGYTGALSNKLEFYNTITNTWITGNNMPTARHGLSCVSIGETIYAIGGYTTAFSNKVEIYNSNADTWSTGANMPTARTLLSCVAVGTKIYAMGGENGVKKLEIYDTLTNTWSTGVDMPIGGFYFGSAVVGSKIYCIGGYYFDGATYTYYKKVEIYDTLTNTWSTGADMPVARDGFGCVSVGAKIYTLCGSGTGIVAIYDTVTNTWSAGGNAPTSRSNLGCAIVGDQIYVIAGSGVNTVEALRLTGKAFTNGECVVQLSVDAREKYATQLINFRNLTGVRMPTYFVNAWLYLSNALQEYPAYYGNGKAWIKFKN